jgi:hypothetical protein
MEYAEFELEYNKVADVVIDGRGSTDLTAAVAHLRTLADQVDDEDDRRLAHSAIAGIEDIIAGPPEEPPSPLVQHAREVFAAADRDDGTVTERIARAEEGIQALIRIASDGTDLEQQAIGALEHSLQMLIGALRLDAR